MTPERFAFDPAGNLIDTETPALGGYVKGNRLQVFQHYRFEYDDVGNLVSEKKGKKETYFTYNAQNQLIKVEKEGQAFEYAYDPFGRRISKKDAFGETTFLWTGDVLLAEQRQNINITYLHEPGSFIPLAQVKDGQIYHYHNDHLGTPQLVTDQQGDVVWEAHYKVYGNVVQYEVEAVENNIRFQGQYFDAETGLHYNRHRYYHPVIGRFTTVDPIGLLGGTNNYEYAPNPVTWIDPLGLSCKEVWDPNVQRWRNQKGRFVKKSKVATEPDTAFFWSGRTNGVGGEKVAADIARSNGGTTLEMVLAERKIKMPDWDPNNPASIKAWENISQEYAANASGKVRGVVGENLRPGNVWENKELPQLKNNPGVSEIEIVDPATLKTTTIYSK